MQNAAMLATAQWALATVRAAGWAPVAVFAAHVLASRILGLYRVLPLVDLPLHLAGGAAIAFFFWRGLALREARFAVGELVPGAAGILSFALAGTAAVGWEFAEWVSDRYFGTHAQLGLEDTLLDMFLGIAGGFVFVAVALVRESGQDRVFSGRGINPRRTARTGYVSITRGGASRGGLGWLVLGILGALAGVVLYRWLAG